MYVDEDTFPYHIIDLFGPRGGDNKIVGGTGIDGVSYYGSNYGLSVDMTTNSVSHSNGSTDSISNIDLIVATDQDDTLIGDNKDNFFALFNGNDVIIGGDGSDTVNFNGDSIKASLMDGLVTALNPDISPNFGTKTLTSIENIVGTDEDDQLIGNDLQNYLGGGGGNDQIEGGGGNDYLIGGSGNDVLTGGSGSDHFVYSLNPLATVGIDTITDFNSAEDVIDFVDYDKSKITQKLDGSGYDKFIFTENSDISALTIETPQVATSLKVTNLKDNVLKLSDSDLTIDDTGRLVISDAKTVSDVKVENVTDFKTSLKKVGDNDASDPINLSDVLAQLKHIIGLRELKANALQAGDTNNDGEVNLSDVLDNLKHIIGLRQIDTFDLVTDNGFAVNALDSDSNGNLTLVINGDADQSHADWGFI